MRFCFCILLLSLLFLQPVIAQPEAYLGWFTDADIVNSSKLAAPAGAPKLVSGGTAGKCIDLPSKPIGLSLPTAGLEKHGIISFWIRPKWDGKVENGGSAHRILRIGDPGENGLLIEVNNAKGLLRFVMAGKNGSEKKITASRTDVSNWKSGDWHHVMVGWLEKDGSPSGLAIWIDRTPVVSTVFGGTRYMDPSSMSDNKLYLGDPSSGAYIDELIIRNSFETADCRGGTPIAYRDYFRTAPYTGIQITHKAQLVESDKRVVAGFNKQFGLIATKVVNVDKGTKTTEYVTCSDGPAGSCWETIDAKPYITWTTSDETKATVDADGLVTGVATTSKPITLKAGFRGMTATYPLSVIPVDQPDLDLMYVERTPRYRRGRNNTKVWPDVGETVTSIIHYGNYGYADSPSFKVSFELIPDSNRNFVVDSDEARSKQVIKKVFDIDGLAAGQRDKIEIQWTWPEYPVFVRVIIDPDDKVSEICEANNQRCELNKARAAHWGFGYDKDRRGDNDNNFVDDYKNKVINLVGSFSDYDWCNANIDRLGMMLAETVYPTTTPQGIQDAVRSDAFMTADEYMDDHNDRRGSLYDGGYEEMWDTRMTLSPGNIHEMGHNVIGLPDIYGHGIWVENILLKDENGNPYGGTPLIPNVDVVEHSVPWTSATWGYPDQLGIGYTPLMVNNHLWLDAFTAGLVQRYAGKRKGLGDYADNFGKMVPTKNILQIFDVNDESLKNARVYVYQCANSCYIYMPNKYYADRPKFIITDGGTGNYLIPTRTESTWDDWDTDGVEGSVNCLTPFDRGAKGEVTSSGIHWQSGEMLLLKIVSNGQVEFQTVPLTEMIIEYFSGNVSSATYPIRTSLTSSAVPPQIELPEIPDTIKTTNLRPVAKVKDVPDKPGELVLKVKKGEVLTFDGSPSYDPEGQMLLYRWDGPGGASFE
ncbi:MAG TPA: CARDB domain-containing protein, partial [Armatimonadota bacterium]|nr:CARDB domain-containing protein [Armatimonadota bacterium]